MNTLSEFGTRLVWTQFKEEIPQQHKTLLLQFICTWLTFAETLVACGQRWERPASTFYHPLLRTSKSGEPLEGAELKITKGNRAASFQLDVSLSLQCYQKSRKHRLGCLTGKIQDQEARHQMFTSLLIHKKWKQSYQMRVLAAKSSEVKAGAQSPSRYLSRKKRV